MSYTFKCDLCGAVVRDWQGDPMRIKIAGGKLLVAIKTKVQSDGSIYTNRGDICLNCLREMIETEIEAGRV